MGRALPAQLESELELPRVVGRRGLTGGTSRARSGIAELVNRCYVGAVEKVEPVGDQVELKAFAERNLFGQAQIDLEEARANEGVAAQIAVTAERGSERWHGECRTVVGKTNIGGSEMHAGNKRRSGAAA